MKPENSNIDYKKVKDLMASVAASMKASIVSSKIQHIKTR